MKSEINLSQEERTACASAFRTFDRDGSGTIDSKELKQVLNALGQNPTDEDVFNMIREVDEDESGEIELDEFMLVVSRAKEKESKDDDNDLLAAFVAMGGNDDGSGADPTSAGAESSRVGVEPAERTQGYCSLVYGMVNEGVHVKGFSECYLASSGRSVSAPPRLPRPTVWALACVLLSVVQKCHRWRQNHY